MAENMIYGITGLFDKPDDIIKAAKAVNDAGYKHYDVHTPYPIHGMPKAMRLKPSRLGYFALAFGLTGTATALLMIFYTMVLDYPLVIGGKPFFSLPAFIPVMFELTVLFASIGTVLAMLFVIFKLPNNSHPLHDTEYLKQVSVDKYGICIEAKDKIYNEEKIREMFSGLGAYDVSLIMRDESELNYKPNVFDKKFIGFLVIVFVMTSATGYFILNKLLYMPPYNWMVDQFRANTQAVSNEFRSGIVMQRPVEGTVNKGNIPFLYADSADLAEKKLTNPMQPTKENLELGKKKYDIYCSPCHGYLAKGDSRLNNQFPNPPTLHSDRVRNWGDGRIYHIIMMGQNTMPSYAKQLTEEERWSVINYVRALQRSANAKEGDLK